MSDLAKEEAERRWRLAIGGEESQLSKGDQRLSKALTALYGDGDEEKKRRGGLGGSAPKVASWLGPEFLAAVEADIHLVADLISMRGAMPEKTKDTAREIIAKVVAELMERLERRTSEALRGAVDKSKRTFNSMATSVVYASIFSAVMASLPVVQTKLVCFDTNIVDLTDDLADPVEVLFGIQLGGGTDINGAVAYCEEKIERPTKAHLILITDLYEGGNAEELVARLARLKSIGVNVIVLLALTDEGRPSYDPNLAGIISTTSKVGRQTKTSSWYAAMKVNIFEKTRRRHSRINTSNLRALRCD